ncbi:MAG TPA: hypothetical protein VIS06_10920 [Mycobacteriales bacterium]
MTGERCDWTDLLVDQCAHCRPDPPQPAADVVEATAQAQFNSRCPVCENWIWPGDPIALVDGVWVCEECAP